jgi:hypothetical protein
MIVLSTELESHGDTASQWLDRYGGEAFTFTLRPDGYATITNPTGQPVALCPRGTGFRDSQGFAAPNRGRQPDQMRMPLGVLGSASARARK